MRDKLLGIIAEHRHNMLGVTYGRKKVAVMAVDMMLADRMLALPEVAEAIEALARENSYSSIYDSGTAES